MTDLTARWSHPLGSFGYVWLLAQGFLMELVQLPACWQVHNKAGWLAGLPVCLIRNRPSLCA